MRTSVSPESADCPIAPEARKSTYARTLHRACLIVGGVEHLAEHLGVPEHRLVSWLQGAEDPPYEVFIAAFEVILLNLDAPRRAS